jgi:hypothetical protein
MKGIGRRLTHSKVCGEWGLGNGRSFALFSVFSTRTEDYELGREECGKSSTQLIFFSISVNRNLRSLLSASLSTKIILLALLERIYTTFWIFFCSSVDVEWPKHDECQGRFRISSD